MWKSIEKIYKNKRTRITYFINNLDICMYTYKFIHLFKINFDDELYLLVEVGLF